MWKTNIHFWPTIPPHFLPRCEILSKKDQPQNLTNPWCLLPSNNSIKYNNIQSENVMHQSAFFFIHMVRITTIKYPTWAPSPAPTLGSPRTQWSVYLSQICRMSIEATNLVLSAWFHGRTLFTPADMRGGGFCGCNAKDSTAGPCACPLTGG